MCARTLEPNLGAGTGQEDLRATCELLQPSKRLDSLLSMMLDSFHSFMFVKVLRFH